jgi:hypothetical protein
LFEESATVAPPSGAAEVNVAVPVTLPPPRIEAGERLTEESAAAGVRLSVDSAHAPFAVADTMTSESRVTADVLTEKAPLVCPAGIVTEGAERLATEPETFKSEAEASFPGVDARR